MSSIRTGAASAAGAEPAITGTGTGTDAGAGWMRGRRENGLRMIACLDGRLRVMSRNRPRIVPTRDGAGRLAPISWAIITRLTRRHSPPLSAMATARARLDRRMYREGCRMKPGCLCLERRGRTHVIDAVPDQVSRCLVEHVLEAATGKRTLGFTRNASSRVRLTASDGHNAARQDS